MELGSIAVLGLLAVALVGAAPELNYAEHGSHIDAFHVGQDTLVNAGAHAISLKSENLVETQHWLDPVPWHWFGHPSKKVDPKDDSNPEDALEQKVMSDHKELKRSDTKLKGKLRKAKKKTHKHAVITNKLYRGSKKIVRRSQNIRNKNRRITMSGLKLKNDLRRTKVRSHRLAVTARKLKGKLKGKHQRRYDSYGFPDVGQNDEVTTHAVSLKHEGGKKLVETQQLYPDPIPWHWFSRRRASSATPKKAMDPEDALERRIMSKKKKTKAHKKAIPKDEADPEDVQEMNMIRANKKLKKTAKKLKRKLRKERRKAHKQDVMATKLMRGNKNIVRGSEKIRRANRKGEMSTRNLKKELRKAKRKAHKHGRKLRRLRERSRRMRFGDGYGGGVVAPTLDRNPYSGHVYLPRHSAFGGFGGRYLYGVDKGEAKKGSITGDVEATALIQETPTPAPTKMTFSHPFQKKASEKPIVAAAPKKGIWSSITGFLGSKKLIQSEDAAQDTRLIQETPTPAPTKMTFSHPFQKKASEKPIVAAAPKKGIWSSITGFFGSKKLIQSEGDAQGKLKSKVPYSEIFHSSIRATYQDLGSSTKRRYVESSSDLARDAKRAQDRANHKFRKLMAAVQAY